MPVYYDAWELPCQSIRSAGLIEVPVNRSFPAIAWKQLPVFYFAFDYSAVVSAIRVLWLPLVFSFITAATKRLTERDLEMTDFWVQEW